MNVNNEKKEKRKKGSPGGGGYGRGKGVWSEEERLKESRREIEKRKQNWLKRLKS
jgi:hypothetical protein